jgi:periplasmic copper chaperone A
MSRLASRLIAIGIALALASATTFAADFQLKSLDVKAPFARATPPGSRSAGIFMAIENKGSEPDRLLSASSPVAGIVEIHEMKMDGGMMQMREVKDIDVRPGATVELKPGGYHIMLMDLKQPLKQGDTVPVTLRFEKAGALEVRASVEAMGATRAH